MHAFTLVPDHLAIGAISGLVSAVAVDYHAFQTWKTWQDAARYNWGMATFRWVQGIVTGIVAASAIGSFLN